MQFTLARKVIRAQCTADIEMMLRGVLVLVNVRSGNFHVSLLGMGEMLVCGHSNGGGHDINR